MDATQIVLIVFIALLVIAYPILISSRNKKENQKLQEQTNSLKRGDKVLTTSGVYGTIVDLQLENDKKIVTIETGTDKKKGYISVDAYAIYTVFRDEPVVPAEAEKVEDKKDSKVEEKAVETVEVKETEAKTEEKPAVQAEVVEVVNQPEEKPAKRSKKK